MTSNVFAWLSRHVQCYSRVVIVLALNVPVLMLALSRYLSGVSWLGGFYAGLVFVGYYTSILLVLTTCLFLVTGAWRRLFVAASGVLITLALYYFVVDAVVYRILKSHLDGFWLVYLATTFEGVGISVPQILLGVALLAGVAALEWWLFRLATRVPAPRRWAIGLTVACVSAYGLSQALHLLGYEANDTRIVGLTPQLPFYFPITSHSQAAKYRDRLPIVREASATGLAAEAGVFRYPLHAVSCNLSERGHRRPNIVILLVESLRSDALNPVVTPRMDAFSQRASRFLNHFSSGNSTPAGVFPVLYGIYSTYWTAVKANSALIHNPVLIDVLEANGYSFGAYAPHSHFERHKIKDVMFRGIEVHESFEGSDDVQDRTMTQQLLDFMKAQKASGKPFLTFAFYKSTHFPYSYPPDESPFQPTQELNVLLASKSDDPGPVRNDYWNSVHYVDALIGQLLERMEAETLLDDTIVVITGDHGEEFNDTHDNSWGHTGNFTKFQSQVPLIVYVPWLKPRQVTAVTSQLDIPPTLMQEGLGCGNDVSDYSNGLNLFGRLPDRRAVIVSSYVNHAFILGDDVFVTWPLYMQRYKLDGSKDKVGWPTGALFDEALKGMGRFYGREERP